WVEDGTPHFSYGKPLFIPSGRQPNYDRRYCRKCCQTFSNRDKHPNYNRILRKKPRKKRKRASQSF
ncbi:MAG: hypothetical protein QXR26_02005, partial [Candidatus Caldarchaeum sp.]